MARRVGGDAISSFPAVQRRSHREANPEHGAALGVGRGGADAMARLHATTPPFLRPDGMAMGNRQIRFHCGQYRDPCRGAAMQTRQQAAVLFQFGTARAMQTVRGEGARSCRLQKAGGGVPPARPPLVDGFLTLPNPADTTLSAAPVHNTFSKHPSRGEPHECHQLV